MKLNLKGVDLNLLPLFEAIMVQGQLSKAAELLGMSQPAASAALQRLRLTFKDELFIRSRQGLQPTSRATEIYQGILPALDGIRSQIEYGNHFEPLQCNRTFKIMGGDYFDMVFLGKAVATLSEQAPNMYLESINGTFDQATQMLNSGELDFFLHYDPHLAAHFDSHQVFTEQLTVLIPPDHPLAKKTLTIDDFFDCPQVALPQVSKETNQLEYILGKHPKKRKIVARVSTMTSMVMTIKAANVIGTLPARLGNQLASHFNLVAKPFPISIPEIPVFLTAPGFASQDLAQQWLGQFLRELFKD